MHKKDSSYLDYNATAPLRPEVRACVAGLMEKPYNASSVHNFGREGRHVIERAREQVAKLVGAPPAQVIFNSGATEGNNTVLYHFKGRRVLVSAIEHSSVLEAAKEAEVVPVTPVGLIDLEALEAALKTEPRAALLSLMLVNNETGVIQPVRAAAALAKKYGALVHCDAVQAAGRIPVDITELGVDFMTLSAHKIAGPQGVGALVLGLCGETPVLLRGGGQEKYARAGTENVAGIAGFGLAAQLAIGNLEKYQGLGAFRDEIETALGRFEGFAVHGRDAPRVVNTSMFSLPGLDSQTALMALDLDGVAVSSGAACSSGSVRAGTVLKAMNVPEDQAAAALRISLGWATTKRDVERLISVLSKHYSRIRNK